MIERPKILFIVDFVCKFGTLRYQPGQRGFESANHYVPRQEEKIHRLPIQSYYSRMTPADNKRDV